METRPMIRRRYAGTAGHAAGEIRVIRHRPVNSIVMMSDTTRRKDQK